jgi:mono/diheme cytochrome c family protein
MRGTATAVALSLALVGAAGCRGTLVTSSSRLDAGVFGHVTDAAQEDTGRFEEGLDSGIRGLGDALGATVRAAEPPPALSGGTLLTMRDRALAVASDPDEDRVVVVSTSSPALLGEVRFDAHAEPGRLVEDDAGLVHVVLRRAGAIATIDLGDPSAPTLLATRAVCPAPRGIAYDASRSELRVVCAGGELVTLPPTGDVLRVAQLEDDLRDVVVDGTQLLVTRFRSATVLVVDAATDAFVQGLRVPVSPDLAMRSTTPSVAWRTIARPGGGAWVLHQRAVDTVLSPMDPMAYGGGGGRGCGAPVVASVLTALSTTSSPATEPTLGCAPLVVDAAVSPDGARAVVAVAGALPFDAAQYRVYRLDGATDPFGARATDGSFDGNVAGRAVAVAYTAAGGIVVQSRAPATITVVGTSGSTAIPLGGADHTDTGFDVFHSNPGAGVACASCHPEAGEDGRVWNFDIGARRTMSLRGGLLATAPFHWQGEFADMSALLGDVFSRRMAGGPLRSDYQDALLGWLDAQPRLPARTVSDPLAVDRGRVLFESTEVGCATCHSGVSFSDELTVDVGTGDRFQVPSLRGLGYRAPYLHDGRAATLADRFTPLGGGDLHGHTSQLDTAQLADLVAYLEAL